MDSVEGVLWLGTQTLNILCYDAIYLRTTRWKMVSRFASLTSEEIIQINFLWCIYLTGLVYTKTTIHLSVGG